ncbi:MAG: LemA family protein [Clostridia bacterium]|nr:LemA family protein [Clostridia bacterium]
MITILIIVAIIIVLAMFVILTYNSLVESRNMVKEAFATMDVYLKKRWDLVPNLVETVKGYSKHESETLEKVIEARGNYTQMSRQEKVDSDNIIKGEVSKLIALSESYPDLKANQNFIDLSRQLVKVEDDIENSRKYYNGTVKNYNLKVLTIPTNIIASMFGFKEEKMFEAVDAERENVKVSFTEDNNDENQ